MLSFPISGEHAKQIRIAANQSGYLLPDHNLKIENKIEVN